MCLRPCRPSEGAAQDCVCPGLCVYVCVCVCCAEVLPHSAALTAQENAVAQTMATSCYKVGQQCWRCNGAGGGVRGMAGMGNQASGARGAAAVVSGTMMVSGTEGAQPSGRVSSCSRSDMLHV